MNRIDDILERLQQQPLPEIVNPDELTESIMDSLPDRHHDTPSPTDGSQRRRVWLYVASALSAAACIALLMVLHFGEEADGVVVADGQMPVRHEVPAAKSVATIETVKVAKVTQKPDVATKAEHLLAAQPAVQPKAAPAAQPKASSAEYQSAVQPSALSSEQPSGQPAAMTAETTLAAAEPAATNADSMAIMVARMESEMQRISDECYMSHLSRVIDSNPQLKRLVDDFISETGKGANTAVCVKEM